MSSPRVGGSLQRDSVVRASLLQQVYGHYFASLINSPLARCNAYYRVISTATIEISSLGIAPPHHSSTLPNREERLSLTDIPHINFGSEFRRPTYDEWSKLISPPTSRQRFPRHLSAEKGLWPLGYPGAFAEIRQAETPLQGLVQKTLDAKPYSISIGQSETISRPIPPC